MSYAGLVIAIVFMILVGVLIFGPILRRGTTFTLNAEADALQRKRESLRLDYAAILQTLRDLEEDKATGKLSDADYEAEKARWSAEGVRVLRERDEARHAAAKLQKSLGK